MESNAKINVMEKLLKLIEKYPSKNWDWEFISKNLI